MDRLTQPLRVLAYAMGCASLGTRANPQKTVESCSIVHTLLTIDNNCVPPSRHPKLDSMPQKFTFTGSEKVLWNLYKSKRASWRAEPKCRVQEQGDGREIPFGVSSVAPFHGPRCCVAQTERRFVFTPHWTTTMASTRPSTGMPPADESKDHEIMTTTTSVAALSADPATAQKRRKPRSKKREFDFPVEPRTIQVVKKPKTFVDHSYRDFSGVPPSLKQQQDDDAKKPISEMTFAEKVFDMLQQERYANWITWLPHGRGFKITVPKLLETSRVLQQYFGHNRYSSFLRQLNNHGFKHLTRGMDRNSYYHECFLRGLPHLLPYMKPGRDARRLLPDPDNEPDLYAISRLCPLPDQPVHKNKNEIETKTKDETAPTTALATAMVPAPLNASSSITATPSRTNREVPPLTATSLSQLAGSLSQKTHPNHHTPVGLSLQSLHAAAREQQQLEHAQVAASLEKVASLQQQVASLEQVARSLAVQQHVAALQRQQQQQQQTSAVATALWKEQAADASSYLASLVTAAANPKTVVPEPPLRNARLMDDPAVLALLLQQQQQQQSRSNPSRGGDGGGPSSSLFGG